MSKYYKRIECVNEEKRTFYNRKVFAFDSEHTCAICGKKKMLPRFPSPRYKDKAFQFLCPNCGRKVDKAVNEWEAVRVKYQKLDNLVRVTARRVSVEVRLEAHLAKLRGRLEKLRVQKLAIKELKKWAHVPRQDDFFIF